MLDIVPVEILGRILSHLPFPERSVVWAGVCKLQLAAFSVLQDEETKENTRKHGLQVDNCTSGLQDLGRVGQICESTLAFVSSGQPRKRELFQSECTLGIKTDSLFAASFQYLVDHFAHESICPP